MALRELEDGIRALEKQMGELRVQHQLQLATADPIGRIEPFAGSSTPEGWLLCDGSAVSRTSYPQLFAAIGTTYGPGNGSSTFNLPDARGRVLVGRDVAQTEFDTLGETGGAKTHTLTESQMPSHTHRTGISPTNVLGGSSGNVTAQVNLVAAVDRAPTLATGGGQPHNNLQPYLTVNCIIRAA